jgi:hypothetical protein
MVGIGIGEVITVSGAESPYRLAGDISGGLSRLMKILLQY